MSKLSLYLAGPLFSLGEREFNIRLRDTLSPIVDVYLPQTDGGLFVEMVKKGTPVAQAAQRVFEGDLRAIAASHYILIVMDGRAIDEGAAFELGYASANRKTCIGLQTDMRRLLPIGNNPMITGALMQTFHDVETLCAWLADNARQHVIRGKSGSLRIATR
jgi:nucleoside 2-deoxyribosyltransferase